MKKKLLAIVLSAAMAFSSISVYADPETGIENNETSVEENNETSIAEDVETTEESAEEIAEEEQTLEVTGYPVVDEAAYSNDDIALADAAECPSVEEVYQRMIAMKDDYPEGMRWTNDNFYAWNGGGIYYGGYGCAGFAMLLSDAAFGMLPSEMLTSVSINRVHPGDILRINNDTHSVIILEVYENYVVIAEGNYNNSIHWGRTLSAAQVAAADYMVTRYPKGYFGEMFTVTYDANGGMYAPESASYYVSEGLAISSEKPVRVTYNCLGWSTDPKATLPDYLPGQETDITTDITLYAVWEPVTYPEVTSVPYCGTGTVEKMGESVFFSFTPDETGLYTIETSSRIDTVGILYDEDSVVLASDDESGEDSNYKIEFFLIKGRTYYIETYFYYQARTGSFDLVVNKKDSPSVTGPYPTTFSVTVKVDNEQRYLFAPEKSGNYTFESKGDFDSYFSLEDIDGNKIGSDDDSGEKFNFKYTEHLERGKEYILVFKHSYGVVDQTYDVTISCEPDPAKEVKITSQPKSVDAAVGNSISFKVTAENASSYQWQYSKDGINWTNSTVSGNKTATLKMTVSATNAKNSYRCLITGVDGDQVTSDVVKVNLLQPAKITSQPKSVTAMVGDKVTFTVGAENVKASGYQWYYSKDGVKWTKSTLTSASTASLTFKVTDTNKANLYRCALKGLDGATVYSASAGMLIINSQPVNAAGADGKTVYFSVKADNIASYQWQYSKDGVKWSSSTVASAKTEKISLKVSDSTKANLYRCKLTSTTGIIGYTDIVYIQDGSLRILSQPTSVTAATGTKISFSVRADNVASYQWQYSKDGVKWSKSTLSSAVTDTVKMTVSDSNRTNQYRCKLTGTDGSVKYTSVVTIN